MLGDAIVWLAFALSGAAGLLFQVTWFHRASLVLGSGLWSVTVVLSSFMAGLALGNALAARLAARVRRPIRLYAALEACVALSGVATTLLLPYLTRLLIPILRLAPEASWQMQLLRFVAAAIVLLVPATAMGATFPVLVGAMSRRRVSAEAGASTDVGSGFSRIRSFGSTLGLLYGWNTAGAVAGVMLADVVAIPAFGISGTAWIAALLDIVAAVIVVTFVREVAGNGRVLDPPLQAGDRRALGPPLQDRTSPSGPIVWLLVCSFLSGAVLLALEVVWFRFLSMFVLSTTLAASLMLAAVLSGIAIGGLVAAIWLQRNPRASRFFAAVAFVNGVLLVLTYLGFQFVTAGTQVGEWRGVLWFAMALTFPTACLSGVGFTLLADMMGGTGLPAVRAAAWVACANTVGALCGPLVAAFVLLPWLGMQFTIVVLAFAYAAIGAVGMGAASRERTGKTASPPRIALLALGGLIALLAFFPSGTMRDRYFARAASAYAADGSTVVALREGPSETIFLMQQQWMGKPVYNRLVTNGFSMTGTAVPGQRYMRYFAYWPMFVHKGPIRDALLVCYGVGVTASAVLQIPGLASLDIAEVSRDIVAMSDRIYAGEQHPLHDPRVRLHIEDGRFFLETSDRRFDLITGEPPPPRTPGTVNIYTREYFQLVYDHLNEGGMATYWIPVARPDPGTDIDTVIRGFCDVFEDCSLWNATPFDLMIAGSRHATGPVSLEEFSAPWQTPKLQASLREIGFERPEQIGATFLGDPDYLKQLTARTPPLTDDYPQRLRPDPSRPSLSDPRYAIDPVVAARFQDVINPFRARQLFESSPLIRRFWPEPLIARSLPFFTQQGVLNQAIWDGGKPLAHIEDLHALLTTTSLRTLPLWVLGSDDVRQRIAESGDDGTGQTDYARALRALTGRDYAGAVALFERAAGRGFMSPNLRGLRAYALFMSGRPEQARQLFDGVTPSGDERVFWEWLRTRSG